jgi:hypothetical protein
MLIFIQVGAVVQFVSWRARGITNMHLEKPNPEAVSGCWFQVTSSKFQVSLSNWQQHLPTYRHTDIPLTPYSSLSTSTGFVSAAFTE